VTPRYTELQLDALRELSNIASGTAATALSQLLGREVELNVPLVQSLRLGQAITACGAPEEPVTGVTMPVEGDLDGLVLMLIPSNHADTLCRLLGVAAGSEMGDSALREIGNILGTSYLGALAAITGLLLLPGLPHLGQSALRRVVAFALAQRAAATDTVLVLDSELRVADEACSLSFLLLPSEYSTFDLLAPLGLGDPVL
jgi:chemotaxis protein CheC